MLLQNYTLRIVLPECNPSSEKLNAIVELYEDISEVLPYLNTVFKGFQYNDKEKILTIRWKGRAITFRSKQIALTKLDDEKEAREVVEELKRIINETYENKDHINPTYFSKPVPRAQEISKLLLGKNCRECGKPTCMAFAWSLYLKLVNNEFPDWESCPLLLTEEFETNRLKLLDIFPDGRE